MCFVNSSNLKVKTFLRIRSLGATLATRKPCKYTGPGLFIYNNVLQMALFNQAECKVSVQVNLNYLPFIRFSFSYSM